eukprot:SAG11_NODE_801_length_7112_cov_6.438329_3_plen_87_part_00
MRVISLMAVNLLSHVELVLKNLMGRNITYIKSLRNGYIIHINYYVLLFIIDHKFHLCSGFRILLRRGQSNQRAHDFPSRLVEIQAK